LGFFYFAATKNAEIYYDYSSYPMLISVHLCSARILLKGACSIMTSFNSVITTCWNFLTSQITAS